MHIHIKSEKITVTYRGCNTNGSDIFIQFVYVFTDDHFQ